MAAATDHPSSERLHVPRLAWVFTLGFTAACMSIFIALCRIWAPSAGLPGAAPLAAAALVIAALVLLTMLLLHRHYLRTQQRYLSVLRQTEQQACIEEETSQVILRLNELVSQQMAEEHRLNEELKELYLATVRAMVATLEARDEYTQDHSLRVAAWAVMLGKHIGLSREDLELLERAALLHDIGKVGLPDDILRKPAALSSEEFAVVKQHPERGERIVQHIKPLAPALPIIRHHHERPDGGGYPDGITEVPRLAMITAVVDCFDAMTSSRPYREPMSYNEAKRRMLDSAGLQFDRKLVEDFFDVLETTGEGYRSIQHVLGIPEPRFREENERRLHRHDR